MRIVIVGQQAFGKAVLEAFIARGDQVAGVFAAPERPGHGLAFKPEILRDVRLRHELEICHGDEDPIAFLNPCDRIPRMIVTMPTLRQN